MEASKKEKYDVKRVLEYISDRFSKEFEISKEGKSYFRVIHKTDTLDIHVMIERDEQQD